MNLYDMLARADKNLAATRAVRVEKRPVDGVLMRGLAIDLENPEELAPALELKEPMRWHAVRTRSVPGWSVVALDRQARGAELILELVDGSGNISASARWTVGPSLQSLSYPRLPLQAGNPVTGLRVRFEQSGRRRGGCVFLAVHVALDRRELLALCRGRGVEIGPGPQPQVVAAAGVDVVYVEESPPGAWAEKYNAKGKYSVDDARWANYTIGTADDLPVPDASLDFVFSSHVFEHLANPLGHLEHWRRKLKPGGRVLAVIPDVHGCKDYVFDPCSVTDLLAEYERGGLPPTLEHYRRYAAVRALGRDPQELMDEGRSIHVHFYTRANMDALLRLAIERLGFSTYRICYTRNHKDFYFALVV